MKRKLVALALGCSLVVSLTACGSSEEKQGSTQESTQNSTEKVTSYTGEGHGYHGKLEVEVSFENKEVKEVKLLSDNESSVIISRAFPLLKERIEEAKSPIVDSVTGATFTSFAVKTAVADAAKKAGIEYGDITFATSGPEHERQELEEVKTQIVIVGGGPAGLSAAIEAKEAGVNDVLLIEKMDILSGNGKFDMNFYDMIESEAQKANGVEDSKEAFLADLKESAWDAKERLEAQAEGAALLDPWLRGMGVELNYNYSNRSHMAEADAYAGEEIQDGLEKKVKELGVEVRTGTSGYDLIVEDGKITGVKVKNNDNQYYDIKADAVIMATGGFSANKELVEKYAPGYEVLETSNQMGATGDFVPVFEKLNFKLDHMDTMRVFPIILSGSRHLAGPSTPGFILVNENGERFVDETAGGLKMGAAIKEQGKVFYIYDQQLNDASYRLQKHHKLGYHEKANSLEELASSMGINAENLKKSVEDFNKAVAGEQKDAFREKAYDKQLDVNGAFYGAVVESGLHMTKGGVLANEKAQIIDNNNEVVPGIYAAGEVASSSASYSASVIFGRISGQEAANYVLNK